MKRIAIIGSGISGLTSAWYLQRSAQVTLFESESRLGGHTDTHMLTDETGETCAVDSGFIVFNPANYPGFCALLKEWGVASQPSDMSFSVHNEKTGIEYGTSTLSAVFADPRTCRRARFYRMLFDLLRFFREAEALLQAPDTLTLGDWMARRRYSAAFIEDHLVPMVGAVWSADPGVVTQFPVRYLLTFMANHHLLQVRGRPPWRTVTGGSVRYIEAMRPRLDAEVRLASPVRAVTRIDDGVRIRCDATDETFDEVVIACHSDQALALLTDPSPQEEAVLGAIRYQENLATVHSDISVMPARKAAWSSWNARVTGHGVAASQVTYWMNRLQSLESRTPWLVSLNLDDRIDPARVHARRRYAHPVYTPDTLRAQSRWAAISGQRQTHYCGAYWGWGFHEDGVQSALRVVGASQPEHRRVAA